MHSLLTAGAIYLRLLSVDTVNLYYPNLAYWSCSLRWCVHGGPKSGILLVFEFALLIDALFLHFLKLRIIFIKWCLFSSADVNKFCFCATKSCNLLTVVGLINDERCLIHNLHIWRDIVVWKTLWKCFQITSAHLNSK